MSATLLSLSALTTSATLVTRQQRSSRRIQPICASHRPNTGFNAGDAFQQAARQFAQFQKQQQRAANQQRPQGRGSAGRTEAFRGAYGPFQWNFDADQMNKFMREMDRAFGGDGSSVPSADTMQEAATCLYFPADLRESSSEYMYLIDLPGVPKSDIKVITLLVSAALHVPACFCLLLLPVKSCHLWHVVCATSTAWPLGISVCCTSVYFLVMLQLNLSYVGTLHAGVQYAHLQLGLC